jgi:hypothetical protein
MAPQERNAAMEEPFGFMIPEKFVPVLSWFSEKLRLLCDRPHPGNPEVELHMEGPRSKKLEGPGGDTTVIEIAMIGFRTKGPSIPSDWAPEHCIVGWEEVREPLGTVMEFWFSPLGGRTYVLASCAERLTTVQCLFENVLKRVEECYPEAGPLGQKYSTQRELRRIERIERFAKMASGAAVAAVGGGPVTAVEDARADVAGETLRAQPAGAAAAQKGPAELAAGRDAARTKDTPALTERADGGKREPNHKPVDVDERERAVLFEYLTAIDRRRKISRMVLTENGFSSESTFNRLKQRVLEDGTLEQLARQWHAGGKLAETSQRLMEKVRKRSRPKPKDDIT